MNPSNLSRDQLIAELLGQVPLELGEPGQCQLELPLQAREQHGALYAECLLRHRLDVAPELLLRDLCARLASGPVMSSPNDLRDLLRLNCGALSHEVFIVLFLDAQHRLIAAEQMFRGTLTQTSVYPREVVKEALTRHAAAVVLAHNPSGAPEPSQADQHLTQILQSALSLCEVRVLDHVIVGGDRIVSMAELGLI